MTYKLRIEAFMTPAREYRINHQEIETCTNLPVRNDSGEKNETILSGASRIISLSFLSHSMKRSSCQNASAVDECVPPNAVVAAPSSFDANPPQTSGVSSDLQLGNLEKKNQHQKLQKTKDALARTKCWENNFLEKIIKGLVGQLTDPINLWVWLAAWIYKMYVHYGISIKLTVLPNILHTPRNYCSAVESLHPKQHKNHDISIHITYHSSSKQISRIFVAAILGWYTQPFQLEMGCYNSQDHRPRVRVLRRLTPLLLKRPGNNIW